MKNSLIVDKITNNNLFQKFLNIFFITFYSIDKLRFLINHKKFYYYKNKYHLKKIYLNF